MILKNWQRTCFSLRKNVWNSVIFIEPCCGRQVRCWFAWSTTKNNTLSLELFFFFFVRWMGEKLHLGILALFDILMQNDFLLQFQIMKKKLQIAIMKERIHFVQFPQCYAMRWGKRRKLSHCCLLFALPVWLIGEKVCLYPLNQLECMYQYMPNSRALWYCQCSFQDII